ncbi:MAG: 2-dehydropantoate 2-reductase [Deltaproteobacteria bacterium]|nr:2-dehydropantoate 2-reductase [Deltaproteobacteria bacterium]
MRILIMGAGAMGGYYGARLVQAGHDVIFIARGAHLEALRTRGLTIVRDEEQFTLHPIQALEDPAQAAPGGPVALVLFTTKAYDLEGAAQRLAPVMGPQTVVLPLLNGVDIAERLGAVLGMAHLLAGLTYLPGNVPRPGVINQPGVEHPLRFGEPGGGHSARVAFLLETFRTARILCDVSEDIRTDLWTKFVLINSTAGACTVTRQTVGTVAGDPDTRALYQACAQETAAVARAMGIALPEDAVEKTMAYLDKVPARNKPSMLQDLERGKPLELETLNGVVMRLGAERGVPTPANRSIYAALKLHVNGRRA